MRDAPIAVITGGTAGIGRATAREFARRGWRVAVLARGHDGLDATCRDLVRLGVDAMAIAADVADDAQVAAAAERIESEWGPIKVWVNNAMATVFCEFAGISAEDFRRATDVTYLGTVWGTSAALRHMQPRNAGTIVQVGSALAYRSIPLQAPYCGAKSAIRGFTDSLRSELIHQRSDIHLTMVHLSAFNTPQFEWGRTCFDKRPQPVPPIFQPELAARAIYWAATHRRRELWVGWPAVQAILATGLIPGLLDRYLAHRAYAGQHTDECLPPGRQDNLHRAVPGDHGAHGRFDARARRHSLQLWCSMHRGLAWLGAMLLALGLILSILGAWVA